MSSFIKEAEKLAYILIGYLRNYSLSKSEAHIEPSPYSYFR